MRRAISLAQYVDDQEYERCAQTAGTWYASDASAPAEAAIKINAKNAGRHMTTIAQVVGERNGK